MRAAHDSSWRDRRGWCVWGAVAALVAACGDGDTTGLTCGPGTVAANGQCVVAAVTPPTLTRARLTYLNVKYDLAKPVFLNNAVPIRFGITATSADPAKPVSAEVTVVFSFVEALPADPAKPRSCDSNGIVLKLVGNNIEQQLDEKIYPTGDCADWVGAGASAHLAVDFDRGLRLSGSPTGIDYPPVVFSAALAGAADNQLCRKAGNPADAKGCVHVLALQPTPVGADGKALVDVKLESLKPESSVVVVWPAQEDLDVPAGKHESDTPSLVVNAAFVMDGKDPYKNKVDPAKIPPELVAEVPTIVNDLKYGLSDAELDALDDLPGDATIRYDIVPSNKVGAGAWLPLAIDDPKSEDADAHVQSIAIRELEPGTQNGFTHALYIEGDTRVAMASGGIWANDDDFTVRGCLVAGFPEGGNAGEQDSDAPVGGEVAGGDCKTFKVRVVRAPPPTTSASAHSFDGNWSRTAGNAERVAVIGSLRTNNALDLSGARSDTEGVAEIKGRIGSTDFGVQLFRIFAKGGALTVQGSSFYDVGVDAFGVNVLGQQQTAAALAYSTPFTFAKTFQFPVLSFGFGPVSIGITAGVGGNVGLTPSITVSAKDGPEASEPALAAATSNGMIQTTVTPNVGLTGNVTGGVDLALAKGQIVATVQVVDIGFPLTATVRWGVTETDPASSAVKKLAVLGKLNWDLELKWLNVDVNAVGQLGVCFFCVSRTFNVWKYDNPTEKASLLVRELAATVLE
jgi:hypothetical protein